jgi:hypothetical protein
MQSINETVASTDDRISLAETAVDVRLRIAKGNTASATCHNGYHR